MKIMITGCYGQLGRELKKIIESGYSELGAIPDVYRAAELDCIDIDTLDIADKAAVLSYVRECAPQLIINCAAYTNVDGCETHEDDAFKANAIGPRNLALAAESIGAKLLHVSTDYVFPGTDSSPRREYDIPYPVSVYGKTKLAGENAVRESCKKYFIVRTAWLYGYKGKNFVRTMQRVGREKSAITVVNDQRGNPTNAVDLAHHILKIATSEEYGVYHVTGNGECSWYDFACKIIEYSGIDAKVTPCTTAEYNSPTKRPEYSSLDHMMLRLTVGDEMRPWEEALRCFVDNDKENKEGS